MKLTCVYGVGAAPPRIISSKVFAPKETAAATYVVQQGEVSISVNGVARATLFAGDTFHVQKGDMPQITSRTPNDHVIQVVL